MDYFKEIEKVVRSEFGIEGMSFHAEILKPEKYGVRDYMMEKYDGDISLPDDLFILKYIDYIDQMVTAGASDYELDQEALKKKWTRVSEVLSNPENHQIFCYFSVTGDHALFDDIEHYISNEFEPKGWVAERHVLSRESFNAIFSDKTQTIWVDYIGIVKEEEEMDDSLSLIKSYERKGV